MLGNSSLDEKCRQFYLQCNLICTSSIVVMPLPLNYMIYDRNHGAGMLSKKHSKGR